MFKESFLQTLRSFAGKKEAALWNDLERHYTGPHRHYHNLKHLDDLLSALQTVKERIQNWPAVVLAVAYHDVIYDVSRPYNEEESAVHAQAQLHDLVPSDVLEACYRHIAATKRHSWHDDSDTNYFTDADLSILGAIPDRYGEYSAAIRSEYSIYPDSLYVPGRRKVLQDFLEMDRIFKTPEFYERYEAAARANLAAELAGGPH